MLTEEMIRAIESERRRDIEATLRRRRWLDARRPAPSGSAWMRLAADVATAVLAPFR